MSLIEAVDYAVMWFGGKTCLFLVDDLWPVQDLHFDDLSQLLRGSPKSKMAISTRSRDVARELGLLWTLDLDSLWVLCPQRFS